MPTRARCDGSYGSAQETGRLGDPLLVESSGIAASASNPGVLWIHNDSGDLARLYAVRMDGRPVTRLVMDGVTAIDFEDLASAPCPDGSGPCLWVADTGNNGRNRQDQTLYAVPEPDLRGSSVPAEIHTSAIWRFPVLFPGPAVDAEALAVSPSLDAIYLFEKVDQARARVFRYRAPFQRDRPVMLETVVEIDSPGLPFRHGRMITGASLHPGGDRLLLRVYTGIYEYRFGPGQTVANLGAVTPRLVTLGPLSEPQGEAVAYDEAGSGIFSVSEDPRHIPGQPLHHYGCER